MSLTLYWPKGFVGLYICPNCLTKNSEFILIKNKGCLLYTSDAADEL